MPTAKRVVFYPFNDDKKFVKHNKDIISRAGYKMCDIRALLSLNRWLKRDTVVVLNWLEDTPYALGISSFSVPLRFLKSLLMIVFLQLGCRKVVWLRHNYQAHNRQRTRWYFDMLCWLLNKLSNKVVYLEPYPVQHDYETCIPHPIYSDNLAFTEDQGLAVTRDIGFAFLGEIRPYKNLLWLLQHWPKHVELKIYGRCKDLNYHQKLEQVISQRQLHVDYQNEFLSNTEYQSLLMRTRFLVLPHQAKSMFSSSMFYDGLTMGCNVLISNSEFGLHKQNEFDSVTSLDSFLASDGEQLPAFKEYSFTQLPQFSEYCEQALTHRWGALFSEMFTD